MSLPVSGMPSIVVTSDMLSNANVQNVSQNQGTVTAMPHVLATESAQPTEQTTSEAQVMLQEFWQKQIAMIHNVELNDFKVQDLPLARIKKIMKMDDEVKMISAEAPLLFAKAAQMFITEISLRAWIHTEENKRRTLQRNDIATAITKFDQFDFLIDIVPREDLKPARRPDETGRALDPVQYYYTVPTSTTAQQTNQTTVLNTNVTPNATGSLQQGQIVLAQPGGQVVQINSNGQIVNSDGQTVLQTSSEPQQSQERQQQNLNNTIVLGNNLQTGTIQQSEGQQNTEVSQNIIQRLISNGGINSGEIHSIQIGQDGNVQLIKVPTTSQQQSNTGIIQTNQINTSDQQQQQRIIRISNEDNTLFEIPALQAQHQTTSNNNSSKNIVYTDTNS